MPRKNMLLRISSILGVSAISLLNDYFNTSQEERVEEMYGVYSNLSSEHLKLFYNYISGLHEAGNGLNDDVMDFQERA